MDLASSEALFSVFLAFGLGLIVLVLLRDDEETAGLGFIFTAMLTLTGLAFIGFFPAWLLIVLIVIAGLLVAYKLGLG